MLGMLLSFYLLKPVKRVTEYSLLICREAAEAVISLSSRVYCGCLQGMPLSFYEAGEASDRVPAAHGEAAKTVIS